MVSSRFLTACAVTGILMTGPGCTHTETLTPEHLAIDSDRDIVVHTKDGRTINFAKGQYKIIGTEYWTIRGKGLLVVNEGTGALRGWQGEIAFQEIQEIQHTESTVFATLGFFSVVSFFALILLFSQVSWH